MFVVYYSLVCHGYSLWITHLYVMDIHCGVIDESTCCLTCQSLVIQIVGQLVIHLLCQHAELSGVTRYFELNEKMLSAHKRVVAGMGADVFQTETLEKFGLVLDDNAVTEVAEPLGWNNSWLSGRAARVHTPVLSQDISTMMHNLGRAPPVFARAAVAQLGEGQINEGQMMDTDK